MAFHVVAPDNGHIVSWAKRLKGRFLRPGSILGEFKTADGTKKKIKSIEPGGFLEKILAEVDESLLSNSPVISLRPCAHDVVMKDLCAACGTDLRRTSGGQKKAKTHQDDSKWANRSAAASLQAVHNIPELLISSNEADKVARDEIRRLHRTRKLVLLVDLDQTIIHTTQHRPQKLTKNTISFQLTENEPWLWTRLRPNCCEFIRTMSKLYEMHIVTFGSRGYAHQIARILEDQIRRQLNTSEKQSFFAHRILSRDECVDPYHKSGNLKHLFPAGDSMVAIIDDRGDVWRHASNCVLVKKYSFFTDTGDINDPHAFKNTKPSTKTKNSDNELPDKKVPDNDATSDSAATDAASDDEPAADNDATDITVTSTTDQPNKEEVDESTRDSNSREAAEEMNAKREETEDEDDDDNDTDTYLHRLETILTRVHQTYFDAYDKLGDDSLTKMDKLPDVRQVCEQLRSEVLANCRLVLSGVVPNNMRPDDHRFVKNAKLLGAQISQHIEPDTTHLVCTRIGTSKYREALKKGITIVHPTWVGCAFQNWERQKETDHPLTEESSANDADADFLKLSPGPRSRERPAPTPTLSMDIMSTSLLLEMDKEVEDILSSEDDDDSQEQTCAPVDKCSDDERTDDEGNSLEKTLQDDLDISSDSDDDASNNKEDNSRDSFELPDAKRRKVDEEVSSEEDDDWDDNMADMLDAQF